MSRRRNHMQLDIAHLTGEQVYEQMRMHLDLEYHAQAVLRRAFEDVLPRGDVSQEAKQILKTAMKKVEPRLECHRYCFVCKKVTWFAFCWNCGSSYCSEHCEWADPEYGEFGSVLAPEYPIHKACE